MRVLRWSTTALVLVVAAVLGAPPSVSATEASRSRPRTAWVVGDSITYLGTTTLRTRLRQNISGSIRIDGVPGRSVADLDNLVAAELRSGTAPDVMVLALGTNPSPTWRRVDYERVVDSIPDTTAVVLVTVYRTRASMGTVVARRMGAYSKWMREIAASRSNVCIAKWRAAVEPTPGRLLFDGVHPNEEGQRVWAGLLAAAAERCSRR